MSAVGFVGDGQEHAEDLEGLPNPAAAVEGARAGEPRTPLGHSEGPEGDRGAMGGGGRRDRSNGVISRFVRHKYLSETSCKQFGEFVI